MNARLGTFAAILLVVAIGCTSSGSQIPGIELAAATVPRASADPGDAIHAADALNAFGIDLYRRVAGTGNAVISPASVALALSMARAGAKGETADQMDRVLRAIASDDHAGWMNALAAALESRTGTFKDQSGKDVAVDLRIANAPFAQRGMPLEPAFLDALASRFGAGLRLVDYRTDPEAARVAIDRWVSDQTKARIPELLAKGDLDTMTRLVLVNAIYLKAAWLNPFPDDQTKPRPFTKGDGTTADVPTMADSFELHYAAGAGWRAVEVPYVGGSLAMTIVMPDDLAAFERDLDGPAFARIVAALDTTFVDLQLPKFGIETQADLAAALGALGMPLAFDPDRADFSGITTAERLSISKVVHQANIDVDEKGTTAAAATAVVMRATAMPTDRVTFHVDHPFLFALRDTQTGAILFLGRVTAPATR